MASKLYNFSPEQLQSYSIQAIHTQKFLELRE